MLLIVWKSKLQVLECLSLFLPLMQVVEGEAASSKVSHWISMHIDVKPVAEDSGSSAAIAQFADDIPAESFIVISGDLLTDVPLKVSSVDRLLPVSYLLCAL